MDGPIFPASTAGDRWMNGEWIIRRWSKRRRQAHGGGWTCSHSLGGRKELPSEVAWCLHKCMYYVSITINVFWKIRSRHNGPPYRLRLHPPPWPNGIPNTNAFTAYRKAQPQIAALLLFCGYCVLSGVHGPSIIGAGGDDLYRLDSTSHAHIWSWDCALLVAATVVVASMRY